MRQERRRRHRRRRSAPPQLGQRRLDEPASCSSRRPGTSTRRSRSWPSARRQSLQPGESTATDQRPTARRRRRQLNNSGLITFNVPAEAAARGSPLDADGDFYLRWWPRTTSPAAHGRSRSSSTTLPGEDPAPADPVRPGRRPDRVTSPTSPATPGESMPPTRRRVAASRWRRTAGRRSPSSTPTRPTRSRLAMQLGAGRHARSARSTSCAEPAHRAARSWWCSARRAPAARSSVAVEQLLERPAEVGAILVADELTTDAPPAGAAGRRQRRAASAGRHRAAGRGGRAASPATLAVVGPAASAAAVDRSLEADGELGRVITVFSTKGGAGKSVIATNLGRRPGPAQPRSRSCWSTPTCSSVTSP